MTDKNNSILPYSIYHLNMKEIEQNANKLSVPMIIQIPSYFLHLIHKFLNKELRYLFFAIHAKQIRTKKNVSEERYEINNKIQTIISASVKTRRNKNIFI